MPPKKSSKKKESTTARLERIVTDLAKDIKANNEQMTSRVRALESSAQGVTMQDKVATKQGKTRASKTVPDKAGTSEVDEHIEALRTKRTREKSTFVEDSSDEEEGEKTPPPKKKGKLVSGRHRVQEGRVKIYVPWPNMEVFRHSTSKHPDPDELTWAEFSYGYTALTAKASPEEAIMRNEVFMEIMDDAQEHKWAKVRDAHHALLDLIELGSMQWDDKVGRYDLRRKHIWGHKLPATAVAPSKDASAKEKPAQQSTVCSYCLETTGSTRYHKTSLCRTKRWDKQTAAQGNGALGTVPPRRSPQLHG